MRTFEVALKVIPRIGDDKKRIPEEKALLDLWLAMDEIKAKVSYKLSCITIKLWTDEFRFIWGSRILLILKNCRDVTL